MRTHFSEAISTNLWTTRRGRTQNNIKTNQTYWSFRLLIRYEFCSYVKFHHYFWDQEILVLLWDFLGQSCNVHRIEIHVHWFIYLNNNTFIGIAKSFFTHQRWFSSYVWMVYWKPHFCWNVVLNPWFTKLIMDPRWEGIR